MAIEQVSAPQFPPPHIADEQLRRGAARLRFVMPVLLIANGAAIGVTALMPNISDMKELIDAWRFGISLAQCGLAGAWAALAPCDWTTRRSLPAVTVAAVCLAIGCAMLREESQDFAIGVYLLLIGQFLATWTILAIVRFTFRRVVDLPCASPRIPSGHWQFSTRHLLMWMLVCGFLLAVIRALMPNEWNSAFLIIFYTELLLLLAVIALIHSLVAVFASTVFFAVPQLWMAIVLSVVFTAVMVFAEIVVLPILEGDAEWTGLVWLHGVQLFWLGVCLAAIRWCGYRWIDPRIHGTA
jgi:hypothetical protein